MENVCQSCAMIMSENDYGKNTDIFLDCQKSLKHNVEDKFLI